MGKRRVSISSLLNPKKKFKKDFKESHKSAFSALKTANILDSPLYKKVDFNLFQTRKDFKINIKNVELNFKPYEFQVKLAENSIKRLNNIICVRTGSGKTLIAALACKYWYTIRKKKKNLDSFRVAFIVPTRFLAQQQCQAFEKAFDKNELHWVEGKDGPDKINNMFLTKKVVFLTAQKFLNTIQLENNLKIFDFDIIVVDECHHTTLEHPYKNIMNIYFKEKLENENLGSSHKPLIIGLSASLGVGKKDPVGITHLIKLCANLDCKKISSLLNDEEGSIELETNIPSPLNDQIIYSDRGSEFDELEGYIKEIMQAIGEHVDIRFDTKKIGEPEFENILALEKDDAEKNGDHTKSIVLKYLDLLNLLFMWAKDLPIDYCIKSIKTFLKKNQVEKPIEIEKCCRENCDNLIRYMKADRASFYKNDKLNKLVDLIIEKHTFDSRGFKKLN